MAKYRFTSTYHNRAMGQFRNMARAANPGASGAKIEQFARAMWIDRSGEVLQKHRKNLPAVLQALGTEAVGQVVQQMQKGYGKPIHKTGDLQRDVNWGPDGDSQNSIQVGNTLEYAIYVHEGHRKRPKQKSGEQGQPAPAADISDGESLVPGRPYLRDGLENGRARLEEVAADVLMQGLK